MKAYLIARWSDHFETPESLKRVKHGSWVSMPNKLDGRGYRRIKSFKDGSALYGVWAALILVASKMPRRGLLCDLDGALNAQDLADKILATKNEVERTILVTSGPEIGWLKIVEWEENRSFAENIALLIEKGVIPELSGRRDGKNSRVTENRQGGNRGNEDSQPGNVPEKLHACGKSVRHDGKNSRVTGNGSGVDAFRESRAHNRTEHDTTIPPTVPQGGLEADDASDLYAAKERVCKILGGKDPRRPWSYQAEAALARLMPIPAVEWKIIEWFHGLTPSDDVFELKSRRRSEVTLLENWSDEVTRAAVYRKKVGAGTVQKAAPKVEPAGWMDAARKIWPHAPLESFWKLTFEEQQQVRREMEVVV